MQVIIQTTDTNKLIIGGWYSTHQVYIQQILLSTSANVDEFANVPLTINIYQ